MEDITPVEKEQMRIADDEMGDIHGHHPNSKGCYGQGTYLGTHQPQIDVGCAVLATYHEREDGRRMLFDGGGSQAYIIID